MTDSPPVHSGESNFAYDHPALVATVVTLFIAGAFIFAIYLSATGHHAGASHGAGSSHGSALPAGSAPAGSAGAKPAPAH